MTISDIIPLCFVTQKIELCDTAGYVYSGTIATLLCDGYDDWTIAHFSSCLDGTLSFALACPFSNLDLWKKGIKGNLIA